VARPFAFCAKAGGIHLTGWLNKCRRFRSGQSTRLQQSSTDFNKHAATGSTAITWNQQKSTDFSEVWNLVRDQGVVGSNPIAPTNARRQFFEAVQLNPRDPVATPIVAQMDELFAVDAETALMNPSDEGEE
jgi:hypothetical protein